VPRGPRPRHDDELRRVFTDHVGAVYALFAYSVDRATAEDLTSATFEKVIRSWRRYDAAKAAERTWILAIARNTMIDHFRRQSHRDTTSTDEHPGLIDQLATGDDFTLRHLEADQPANDIAEMLGLSSANVHQIISRSLRKLRAVAAQPPPGSTSS
jgi:RNA polymerase sigma-70 factor (ECF subfamily)